MKKGAYNNVANPHSSPTPLEKAASPMKKAHLRRGVLIAVEGIDGSGKTTQSYGLVSQLRQFGHRAEYTAEPTYGPVGNIIRLRLSRMKNRRPMLEALLFAADRYYHVEDVILPKLADGAIVVSDRYVYSSLAYQGAAGVELEWIRQLNRFAPKPNLTLYLDVDPKTALERKAEGRTVFEKLETEAETRRLYLRLARQEKFVVVDASKPPHEVEREILSAVQRYLRSRKVG